MKLAISNIAWDTQSNEQIYTWMKQYGYSGLEVAPTKIFPQMPYEHLSEARQWSKKLYEDYGFSVPSMQSIWFGRQEKLFGTKEEYSILLEYTKKAILFAETIGCDNLVFGCPKNRQKPADVGEEVALEFFHTLGEYAKEHGTTIGMEANPPMYQTNYINDTASALELVHKVNSKGFLLNLDIGTMIANEETVALLKGKVSYISHIHISEPRLKPIKNRKIHQKLMECLQQENYQNYVSIEMGMIETVSKIEPILADISEIFS